MAGHPTRRAPTSMIDRLAGGAAVWGLLLFASVGALPQTATAGPLLDAAIEAEKLAAGGDAKAAFARIHDGLAGFSQTLPLTIPRAVFITEKPTGYGAYTARPKPVFRPDEALMTYLEVVGLRWRPTADQMNEAHFTVDLELKTAEGRLVALKTEFGNIALSGRSAAQEVFTHLTLELAGAAPGAYLLRYTVNDVISERSVSFDMPFTIAEPG